MFRGNVGEMTMDREIHEQIAQRAYALWQAELSPTVGTKSTGIALRVRSQPQIVRTPPP